MAIRVSYGAKDSVAAAIQSGIIPKDSIIITRPDNSGSSELMFYDKDSALTRIVTKSEFASTDEAVEYAKANSRVGGVITVLQGGRYVAYTVQADFSLLPMGAGEVPMATNTTAGIVMGTADENGVSVNNDGTMSVNSVNIMKLSQNDGDEIIFNCGSASD